MLSTIKNISSSSFKNPLFKKNDSASKPATVKKPISSFTKFIFFMLIIFGIIGTLFAVYTLNNPDVLNFISNINPSFILFVFFMAFIYSILLSFILGILSFFLFDINGSTMFFLFIHLFLLCVCSPYFLIVLIRGTYKYFTDKKESSSGIGSSSSSSIELGDGKQSLFGKMKLIKLDILLSGSAYIIL
jgi:hypothetical protein